MKKFDPHSLPYIAATAQAVQIGHAGYILAGIPGAIIGGLVGACVSFSVAYASSQIASLNGQKREKWANTSMLGIMVLSPLLVTAPIYISFGEITFGWLRWITAGSWALAPDMSIFLAGLITGKGLVKQEEKQTESKPKPEKLAFSCFCGRSFKTQAAWNGHQSAHKPKGYAVEFTPIDKAVTK